MKKLKHGSCSYSCEYCNDTCKNLVDFNTNKINIWYCNICDVRYTIVQEHQILIDKRLYVDFNSKRYCAKFTYSHDAMSFEISEIISKNNFSLTALLTLDYHPDLSPNSIKDKIKTILLYS